MSYFSFIKLAKINLATVMLISIGLSGCQSPTGPGNTATLMQLNSLHAMEHVAITANKCWFKSKDPQFLPYGMALELYSRTSKPRMMLVNRNTPNGLPLVVIEANGEPATINAFGPLMAKPIGNRISHDIKLWTSGTQRCR